MSNIFSNYKVPELNLTKAFINILEHTNLNLLQKYLNGFDFKFRLQKVYFNNVQYEQEVSFENIRERLGWYGNFSDSGRVDGVIRSENLVIYIESKYGTRFRENQLDNYQKLLSKEKAKWRILLLISDSERDAQNVKFRAYKNIHLFADDWNRISQFCESIKERLEKRDPQKYSREIFLLDQFSEYLGETGVVSFRGFTKSQIYILENCDLSKSKYLDDGLKDQVSKLFGGIKKKLIELGFEEEGFTWQVYSPRLKTPVLKYRPPEIRKDKNLEIRFALKLAPSARKRSPMWQFEFYERKSGSKFFKNILENSNNFKRKLNKINIPIRIWPITRRDGVNFYTGKEIALDNFKPEENITALRNKKHFFAVSENLEPTKGNSMYEDDHIQMVTSPVPRTPLALAGG